MRHFKVLIFVLSLLGCAKEQFQSQSNLSPFSLFLGQVPKVIRGGKPILLEFGTRSNLPSPYTRVLQVRLDGATFSEIASLPKEATSYLWNVPEVDQENVLVRLVVRDQLENESTFETKPFKIITHAPQLIQNLAAGVSLNNLSNLIYGGYCKSGLDILVTTFPSNLPTAVECKEGQWRYEATLNSDSSREYHFSQTDELDNKTEVVARWTRDTVAPLLTLSGSQSVFSKNSIELKGTCETLGKFKIGVGGVFNDFNCDTDGPGRWKIALSQPTEGIRQYVLSDSDDAGNSVSVPVTWIYETSLPRVVSGSVTVGNGVSTPVNYTTLNFRAQSTVSKITEFCTKLAYGFSPSVPTTPEANDSCWNPVNNPEGANVPPSKSIVATGVPLRIGFTPNLYSVYVFVKTEAGNISNVPEYGTIRYEPGRPPSLINVIASRTANPQIPVTHSDSDIPYGAPVFIRWNLNAPNGINANPISLFYTTDDVNWTQIASGIADNNACPSSSLPPQFSTGCYIWNQSVVPTGKFFKIRVSIEDKNGMVTFANSNFLNDTVIKSLAGNTENGLGASAASAMLFNERSINYLPDPNSFVVLKDGSLIFRDLVRGILTVNPKDGVLKTFLPLGTNNTYSGNLSHPNAMVKNPVKIALDYRNHLLIWDSDRIRSVDLKTLTISNFIGGGSSQSDGVPPLDVKFTEASSFQIANNAQKAAPLIPLPNGDLLFQSDYYGTSKARLRIYHALSQTVDSVYVSGAAHGSYPGEVTRAQEDIQTCTTTVAGIVHPCSILAFSAGFNPTTSTLNHLQAAINHIVSGNSYRPFAALAPTGSKIGQALPLAMQPQNAGNLDTAYFRITGRDGKIYTIDKHMGRIVRFAPDSPSQWKMIAGTGNEGGCSTQDKVILCPYAVGDCADGTPALQCALQPDDAFVDSFGIAYMMDRGRLRTIDENGKMLTLYGQSYSFGDKKPNYEGIAISARFGLVDQVEVSNKGNVVLVDRNEARIRSIDPKGTIVTLAGNGSYGSPDLIHNADLQPLQILSQSRENDQFRLDPNSGEIYFQGGAKKIYALPETGGTWRKVATGLPGTGASNILGFENGLLLLHAYFFDYNINEYTDPLLSLLDLKDLSVDTLASYTGSVDPRNPRICTDGTPLSNCILPDSNSPKLAPSTFIADRSQWLLLQPGTKAVRALSTAPGALMQTIATLAKPAISFAYKKDSKTNQETLYYCGKDPVNNFQTLYAHQLNSSVADTALHWPVQAIQCSGLSLAYDPSQDRLVFPYSENGMNGVAEYDLSR